MLNSPTFNSAWVKPRRSFLGIKFKKPKWEDALELIKQFLMNCVWSWFLNGGRLSLRDAAVLTIPTFVWYYLGKKYAHRIAHKVLYGPRWASAAIVASMVVFICFSIFLGYMAWYERFNPAQ